MECTDQPIDQYETSQFPSTAEEASADLPDSTAYVSSGDSNRADSSGCPVSHRGEGPPAASYADPFETAFQEVEGNGVPYEIMGI